jgi:hypothetical protein
MEDLAKNMYEHYRNIIVPGLEGIAKPAWDEISALEQSAWKRAADVYDVNIQIAHTHVKLLKDMFSANMKRMMPITQEELDKHISDVLEKTGEYFRG